MMFFLKYYFYDDTKDTKKLISNIIYVWHTFIKETAYFKNIIRNLVKFLSIRLKYLLY